jgi:tRNA threonylcarbamoyladenosine biosynthesis protein TsaE
MDRRRAIQRAHNIEHGITPQSIVKSLEEVRLSTHVADARTERVKPEPGRTETYIDPHDPKQRERFMEQLERRMREASANLEFEEAAAARPVNEPAPWGAQRAARGRWTAVRQWRGRRDAWTRRSFRGGGTDRRALVPGSVVYLQGELGVGKTTMVQAIARGLGVEEPASSPTYALVHRYAGRRGPVFHLDCFRLQQPEESADLDWEGLAGEGDALLIEWPERAAGWAPAATLRIKLDSDPPCEARGRLMRLAIDTGTSRLSVALGNSSTSAPARVEVPGSINGMLAAGDRPVAAAGRMKREAILTVVIADGLQFHAQGRRGSGEGAGRHERRRVLDGALLLTRAAWPARRIKSASRCVARQCYAGAWLWLPDGIETILPRGVRRPAGRPAASRCGSGDLRSDCGSTTEGNAFDLAHHRRGPTLDLVGRAGRARLIDDPLAWEPDYGRPA